MGGVIDLAYIPRETPHPATVFVDFATSFICGHMSARSLIELVHAFNQVVFDGTPEAPTVFRGLWGLRPSRELSLSHAGVYLLDDQVEPGPHFALFFRVKVKTYLHCSHAKPVRPIGTGGPQCLAGSPQQAT